MQHTRDDQTPMALECITADVALAAAAVSLLMWAGIFYVIGMVL